MAFVMEAPGENATRAALLDAIRARPGSTVSDLAREAGVAHTTATYHLRRLGKTGAVVSLRQGGRLHFFLNGQATPEERTLVVCRRLGRSEAVLARIPREAAVPLGVIADGLPMTKAGVFWHLNRLSSLGLVEAMGEPGARVYRAVG